MRWYLLFALICSGVLLPAAAYHCYVCDSKLDPKCMQPWNLPTTSIVDCDAKRAIGDPLSTGCLIAQYKDGAGMQMAKRDCYYGKLGMQFKCPFISPGIEYCIACNYTDNCNNYIVAGSGGSFPSILVLLGVVGAALVVRQTY